MGGLCDQWARDQDRLRELRAECKRLRAELERAQERIAELEGEK